MCSALATHVADLFPAAGQSGDTSVARADRLTWLLQGLLEAQSLINDEASELEAFMQRGVDLAQNLTGAAGAVVELVEGEEMVYRCASGSIREHVGLPAATCGEPVGAMRGRSACPAMMSRSVQTTEAYAQRATSAWTCNDPRSR